MIMSDFNINLMNYNDDINTGNFLDRMFSQSFLQHPLETLTHLLITSIITSLSIILFLET